MNDSPTDDISTATIGQAQVQPRSGGAYGEDPVFDNRHSHGGGGG